MTYADLSPLTSHLWQSTLFAAAVWLLTLALRRNRAALRYGLWLAASVKFLVPFSLLVDFGSRYAWQSHAAHPGPQIATMIYEIGRGLAITSPISPLMAAPHVPSTLPTLLLALWLCGFTIRLISWLRWMYRIKTIKRAATPLELNLPIPAMVSTARLEPGVFGIRNPVLLLPHGMTDHLTAAQLETVLRHEMCHIRRRDNLTGAIHMLVETVFWFHPLVWWMTLRLVDERERACDEEVCSQGSEPEVYAEAILDVCKFYLELPRLCAAGVTGAHLKKRIERIMTRAAGRSLDLANKLLLAAAGLVAIMTPIAIGIMNAPQGRAQPSATRAAFEVAAIKPANPDNRRHWYPTLTGDRFTLTNATLKVMVELAYDVRPSQISGGPKWADSEKYDLQAKADSTLNAPRMRLMLQSLLADRFKLILHREDKVEQLYELVVAKGGPKFKPAAETEKGSGEMRRANGQLTFIGAPISWLAMALSGEALDRYVVDKTGLEGHYDFTLQWTPDQGLHNQPQAPDALPRAESSGPSIFTALQEQLGLQLKSAKGPVEILVIDEAGHPTEN